MGTERVPMSDQTVRKPWWHRFSFRLRSLMIAIGIICVAMGWIIHRAQVQRDVVTAVQRPASERPPQRETDRGPVL
jgi:hypothetical protein